MAREKKLPTTLFVIRNSDDESEWFEATESIETLAEMAETKMVGTYQLVKTHKVTGIAKVE